MGIFLDFVWRSGTTRTPHGAYARRARRNRIDPHGGGIERLTYSSSRLASALLPAYSASEEHRLREKVPVAPSVLHRRRMFASVWALTLPPARTRCADHRVHCASSPSTPCFDWVHCWSSTSRPCWWWTIGDKFCSVNDSKWVGGRLLVLARPAMASHMLERHCASGSRVGLAGI